MLILKIAGGIILAFVVLFVGCVVLLGVALDSVNEKSEVVVKPGVDAPTGAAGIGATQRLGNVEVTVHGARDSAGGLLRPKEGFKYVIVDVAARNISASPYSLSSLLQASLLDSEDRKFAITIGADEVGSFNGTIAPGDTIRGEVAFEVPLTSSGFRFVFGQALGTGQAVWSLE